MHSSIVTSEWEAAMLWLLVNPEPKAIVFNVKSELDLVTYPLRVGSVYVMACRRSQLIMSREVPTVEGFVPPVHEVTAPYLPLP